MEKSAASEACFPSFPTIPTPASAAWIILTSFPPSPEETANHSKVNHVWGNSQMSIKVEYIRRYDKSHHKLNHITSG